MANELLYVVDDDPGLRELIQVLLEEQGYRVLTFENGKVCLDHWEEDPSAILLDMVMPVLDGKETLKKIKEIHPDIPVIMVTSVQDVETVVGAMKLGAYDYLTKPFEETRLITSVEKALQQHSLTGRVKHLEREVKRLKGGNGILGNSKALKVLLDKVHKVESSKANVLILGESGTGKELLARAIHENSTYSKGAFVDINCGAIPETLQESELFGHKKGAFTGAVDSKVGKLELADGGTLFLDEVGEMDLNTQTKFLRFLQERYFERVGDHQKIKIDTRVLAATNRDLKKEVEQGNFREDLYYRIAVFPVTIPPLRERKEDIPLLCMHFLKKYKDDLNKDFQSIAPEALRHLTQYPWPGNIRQLENAIYQAMIISEPPVIDVPSLPEDILDQAESPQNAEAISQFSEKELKPEQATPSTSNPDGEILPYEEVIKNTLANALEKTHGNIPKAAKELQLSRSTFYRMVKKYDLG